MRYLFLILFFNIGIANAQNNFLTFGLTTPYKLPGLDKFYNDNWLISGNGTPGERTYYRIGFLVEYLHQNKNDKRISLKLGVTYRNIFEKYTEDFYYSSMPGQNGHSFSTNILKYNQLSWNLTAGYQFTENFQKFTFHLTPEIIFLHIGTGNQYNHNRYDNIDATSSNPNQFSDYESDSKISGGNCYGIGATFGFDFQLKEKLFFGVTGSFYTVYSFFNNESTLKTYGSDNIYWSLQPNGYPGMVTYNESSSSIKENFKQLSMTSIIPTLRIKFKL